MHIFQKRIKLDDKSKKWVLLGVSDESKAYKLYDPVSKKIIISKDVIFEEDVCWNWDIQKVECRPYLLEWKNDYENDIEGVEGNEEGGNNDDNNDASNDNNNDDTANSIESNSSSSEHHEDDSPNAIEGRVRKTPSWMADYETGEGLSDEDNLNAMMMLAEDDPLSFEKASKSNKWRGAMRAEIELIENNKTWEFTVLSGFIKLSLMRMER